MNTSSEHQDTPAKTKTFGAAWNVCIRVFYDGDHAKTLSAGSLVAPFLAIYLVMLPLSLLGLDLVFAWVMGAFMQIVGLYGYKQAPSDLWTQAKKEMAWRYWFSGLFFMMIAIFQQPDAYQCLPGVTFVVPGMFY
jgi:hypothetical protein